MNKFEKLEEANEKLFDSPLKNPLNSKDLQEDWGNKIILIGKQYPKKSWIGIVFISTIANEKEVNGYILTIKDGKPIKHFIVAKYKGLNVLADYNQL